MSGTVIFSGTISLGGNSLSLAWTITPDYLRVFDFELAAGAVMALTFDATHEGDDAQFLLIRALNTSDATQHTEVSYGVSDSDASDPANGSGWKPINGFILSREYIDLSSNGKLYIYNSGSNRATVTVSVGLDGA